MNQISCCFLILLCVSVANSAEPISKGGNYWQCSTQDATHVPWTAQNSYQKIALNFSYALCKKESQVPATCKTSTAQCIKFVDGVSIMPMWQCTALDRDALPWRSELYQNREDAALAAKAYCKQRSSIPDTCYINLVMCLNKNEL